MSVGDKRVKGVRPRHAVSRVARRALEDRFAAVHYFLPRAARRPGEDMEYVHQLRVATRRGLAAMALFCNLLPPRRARRLERDLKRLRRAAGSARDLDVLAAWIRGSGANQDHDDCQAVIHLIWDHRRKAQRSIVKAHKALRRSHFRRRVRTLIDKTCWRCQFREPRFGEVAAGIACPLVTAFFAAATADVSAIEALHTMRIQAKRLRYALELLAPAFERSLRNDLFAAFAQLQTRLGEINDRATATTLFEKWIGPAGIPDDNSRLALWLATAREDLVRHRVEFIEWWTVERTADLRRRFDRMLLE
jgi:CHAD domain-containing protein